MDQLARMQAVLLRMRQVVMKNHEQSKFLGYVENLVTFVNLKLMGIDSVPSQACLDESTENLFSVLNGFRASWGLLLQTMNYISH